MPGRVHPPLVDQCVNAYNIEPYKPVLLFGTFLFLLFFSCIKVEFISCDAAYFGLHPSSDPLQLHLFNLNHHLSQQDGARDYKTNKMKPYIGIPLVVGLVYRAWSRKSLTPLGLVVAGCSASAHALHPWSAPVALLAVFYFGGTKVTKV
jgi:hypothetical protein